MAQDITVNDNDRKIAENGTKIQYEAMFDAETRAKLEELGMGKFIDYHNKLTATHSAWMRFYEDCLHSDATDAKSLISLGKLF